MLVQEPVHTAIWHCLNHYAFGDATFLAERLSSEVKSEDTLHLLATCYYRSGLVGQAYDVLHAFGPRSPKNKFLLAKCCVELKKCAEAEMILSGGSRTATASKEVVAEEVVAEFGESSSFVLQLLARVYASTERIRKANETELSALLLNPFLWKSFEALCNRGATPEVENIFNVGNLDSFVHCMGFNPILNYANVAASSHGPPAQHQGVTTGGGWRSSTTSTPILPPHPSPYFNSQGQYLMLAPAKTQPQTPQQHSLMTTFMTPVNPMPACPQFSDTGSDSCFVTTPVQEPSSVGCGISGVKLLSFTSGDVSSSLESRPVGGAPMPPPPLLRPRKRFVASKLSASKKLRFQLRLMSESGGGGGTNRSFGQLPQGPLKWTTSPQSSTADNPAVDSVMASCRLAFSPLAILSPCSSSQPPQPPSTSLSESSICALSNSTNNENKRSLLESHPLKSNLSNAFGAPSSSSGENMTPSGGNAVGVNNNINQSSAVVSSMGGGVGGGGGGGLQNVRRSSRLFGSSQQTSVKSSKENNTKALSQPAPTSHITTSTEATKTSSRTPLKSPSSRKTKSKLTKSSSSVSEYNEKNRQEHSHVQHKIKDDKKSSVALAVTPVINMSTNEPSSSQCGVTGAMGSQDTAEAHQLLNEQAILIQKWSSEGLMDLMKQLGSAYLELSRYKCRKALKILEEEVPMHQRETGWVLGLIGKAYFDMMEWKKAKKSFEEMRSRDPHRLELTEYYSTALWHLQEEVELSSLAQELTRIDKYSPQAWCAAGNCFSHQKEHENAIKFFQRAVQVDPDFAYAYTLLGHEYVFIEELEKALACFRSAVRVDPRHYNAWYGIGSTCYKQERYPLAEIYFRKAAAINSQSPVLLCHIAVVQHALKQSDKALSTLDKAIKMAPKNVLCKFERASILFSLERFTESLEELNELKLLCPKESSVYFLIGNVHSRLGNPHLAVMNVSWAMDLDPKGANSQIKDALDPALSRISQEGDVDLIEPDELQASDPPVEMVAANNIPSSSFQRESDELMALTLHMRGGADSAAESPENNQRTPSSPPPPSAPSIVSSFSPATYEASMNNFGLRSPSRGQIMDEVMPPAQILNPEQDAGGSHHRNNNAVSDDSL